MEETTIRTTDEVFDKKHAIQFDRLIGERQALKELQKQTEAELKDIDQKLMIYLADADDKTILSIIENTTWKVTQVQNSGRGTIKAELLVERGVPAETVKECTVWSKPSSYILVTEVKKATL